MKKIFLSILVILLSFTIVGCVKKEKELDYENDIYYTLFVRSFADSNNDGIGDLQGVTDNLDYLEELGITAIWLLPIFEANSYHGYDTTDYYSIKSEYGSMTDFDNLIKKAKEKNIKIMLDLVINHTSDQHPWFLESKKGSDNEYRDYYVWQNGNPYQSFTGGLMDLNLSNVEVINEIKNIIDFYIDKGVKGFRFDAVKHFFEEDGPRLALINNLQLMAQLNTHIKSKDKDVYVVGEVLENDFQIVSNYSRSQNSYFNFYLKEEIINKVGLGSSSYLFSSNLRRMYESYEKYNSNFVDSIMLGNHDLDRIASLVKNEDRLALTINTLLTLPGSPFIYYGDELGMKGVRAGEGGVTIDGITYYDELRRQPFIWKDDRQTTWLVDDFSNKDTKSYAEAKEDKDSIFNVYKNMINIRKSNPALMYGNEIYPFEDGTTQGYLRVINDDNFKEAVLVIHNLSNKDVTLDYKLKAIYGSNDLKAFETAIFKVPFKEVEAYK